MGRQASMDGHQAHSLRSVNGSTSSKNDLTDRAARPVPSGADHDFEIKSEDE